MFSHETPQYLRAIESKCDEENIIGRAFVNIMLHSQFLLFTRPVFSQDEDIYVSLSHENSFNSVLYQKMKKLCVFFSDYDSFSGIQRKKFRGWGGGDCVLKMSFVLKIYCLNAVIPLLLVNFYNIQGVIQPPKYTPHSSWVLLPGYFSWQVHLKTLCKNDTAFLFSIIHKPYSRKCLLYFINYCKSANFF